MLLVLATKNVAQLANVACRSAAALLSSSAVAASRLRCGCTAAELRVLCGCAAAALHCGVAVRCGAALRCGTEFVSFLRAWGTVPLTRFGLKDKEVRDFAWLGGAVLVHFCEVANQVNNPQKSRADRELYEDTLRLEDPRGVEQVYHVSEREVRHRDDLSVEMHPLTPVLYLVTCWPIDGTGEPTDERLVIKARAPFHRLARAGSEAMD